MKHMPINVNELMTQGAERILQEEYEKFVQKHIDREKQKREQKKREAEASHAEVIRQPVENPA